MDTDEYVDIDKKCCVPNCGNSRKYNNVILHNFPNPTKEPDRFCTWLYAIGSDLLTLKDDIIHRNRRVCHKHFESKYHTRSKRLSVNAVPTLFLTIKTEALNDVTNHDHNKRSSMSQEISHENIPSSSKAFSVKRKALNDITNHDHNKRSSTSQEISHENIPSSSKAFSVKRKALNDITDHAHKRPNTSQEISHENIPSSSKEFPVKRKALNDIIDHAHKRPNTSQEISHENIPSSSKAVKPPKGHLTKIFSSEASALARKIKTLQRAKQKYSEKIKKALRLSENKTFQKAIHNFTTLALMFTLMQFREANKKKMGRRFTKREKVMALALYKQGPRAYRWLRNIFVLPAPVTLSRIISAAALKPGLNEHLFQNLKKSMKNKTPLDQICILLFDEIAISPHFDYNRKRDQILGFVDNGTGRKKKMADHALVFMIRGVIRNYKLPVSYTFCSGSTSKEDLVLQIKYIIRKLNSIGMNVLATVCDQGASNTSAINYLIQETKAQYLRKNIEHKKNVFEIDNKEIVPLFDPPHLIKGIRNNLLTKTLTCTINGERKTAKWRHILSLYQENPEYNGLRFLPKLTEFHVNPKKIKKMKVKMATQVLSRSVGMYMGYLARHKILEPECSQTADIILFFDKLFDSVNGSYVNFQKNYNKPLLGPVTPKSPHQAIWNEAKSVLKTMRFESKNNSVPSVKNWLFTIENFEYLKKKIFEEHNFKSIWLRHFNQDPLENFFGCIRSHGGRNINPSCSQFETAFASLLINNISGVHSPGANCEDDKCRSIKSLGKLFFSTNVTGNCVNTVINFDHLNTDIIVPLEDKKKDPKIYGALSYVMGYVLRKAKIKIFKNCSTCKANLCDESKANELIRLKELSNKKSYLTYPADSCIEIFSIIQDYTNHIIRDDSCMENIRNYIKTVLYTVCNFNFIQCEKHKSAVVEFVLDLACRFFLNLWCKNINKILKGSKDDFIINDIMHKMAYEYRLKHSKKHL